MDFLVRGRGQGKTEHLLAARIKNMEDTVLVVHTVDEQDRLIARYGVDENDVITYRQLLEGNTLNGRKGVRLLIDNVDLLLQTVVGPHEIKLVTATGWNV